MKHDPHSRETNGGNSCNVTFCEVHVTRVALEDVKYDAWVDSNAPIVEAENESVAIEFDPKSAPELEIFCVKVTD